ncbi:hypothetical protein EMPS_10536 [Entomortierella parvispora]|uniref:Uncharacterized protein n=1 Tax=Entomortierella parvispora TaxID=205924 RepID=A0A9P3HK74_9FUNG|nr:hypothetical protein EMPS_10536 [Entomortierella parvispora]
MLIINSVFKGRKRVEEHIKTWAAQFGFKTRVGRSEESAVKIVCSLEGSHKSKKSDDPTKHRNRSASPEHQTWHLGSVRILARSYTKNKSLAWRQWTVIDAYHGLTPLFLKDKIKTLFCPTQETASIRFIKGIEDCGRKGIPRPTTRTDYRLSSDTKSAVTSVLKDRAAQVIHHVHQRDTGIESFEISARKEDQGLPGRTCGSAGTFPIGPLL